MVCGKGYYLKYGLHQMQLAPRGVWNKSTTVNEAGVDFDCC